MPVETTAGGTKAGARWSLTALPLHRLEDRGGRDEVRSRSIARMVRLAALTAAACTHPEPAALAEVRQDYFLHCMGCHGENGAGMVAGCSALTVTPVPSNSFARSKVNITWASLLCP